MKQIKLLSLLSFCLLYLTTIGQTHFVQNLNDSGVGSFRETISLANPDDTIRFNPSLIALGSDTLVLDSVIHINKNLVIKGLYNNQDTLCIRTINNNTFFLIDSVENILMDSLVLCDSPGGFSGPFWISTEQSNLTLENSRMFGFLNIALYFDNSSYEIKNCELEKSSISTGHSSIHTFSNDGNDHSYEIKSTLLKSPSVYSALYMSVEGPPENNHLIIKDSYFKNMKSLIWGELSVDIVNSTFMDATIKFGGQTPGVDFVKNEISLNATSSTFEMTEMSHALICDTSYFYSNPNPLDDYFLLNFKNCTFNGGIYDSTLNIGLFYPVVFQDYFGPQVDELKIEGCIFNDINGFNELPIDLSGGYNLFGFPQTTGLHSTDLQNVSNADIDLGPLQNNGGFTPTHLPSYQSLAFNAGNPYDTSSAQNGTINQRRDIGAAEIQALKFTDTATHCGVNYLWRDSLFTETDRYFEIIEGDSTDLDTVFALDLSISNLQAQAINDWGLLTANESGAQYQWIDCNTDQPIFGETNQEFTPSTAGNYQVIIDNGICVDTSACVLINNIGLEEERESLINAFVSQSTLRFFGNKAIVSPFTIYNVLGQSVFQGSTINKEVELLNFTPGVYFIEFNSTKNINPIKFVVE